jgi:hypothetical protein
MTQAEAEDRVTSFKSLDQNWDSYEGKPIDPVAIRAALILLPRLGDGWTPVPCSDGSIQMEGYVENRAVEILIQGWEA